MEKYGKKLRDRIFSEKIINIFAIKNFKIHSLFDITIVPELILIELNQTILNEVSKHL